MTTPDKPQFTHDLIEMMGKIAWEHARDIRKGRHTGTRCDEIAEDIRALKSSIQNVRILGPEEVAVPRELIEAVVCRLEVETGNAAIGFARRLRAMLSSSSPQHSGAGEQKAESQVEDMSGPHQDFKRAIYASADEEDRAAAAAPEQKAAGQLDDLTTKPVEHATQTAPAASAAISWIETICEQCGKTTMLVWKAAAPDAEAGRLVAETAANRISELCHLLKLHPLTPTGEMVVKGAREAAAALRKGKP